ncbi:uroporphyrinogen-III synthase /uroporphyrinogen-III C-methyltransferase [Thermosyntropha lipolytica DSM 11003]|uniref:uroporphyrinogen-III C-methyltransferase n=1 Tax=Thermosyntropha lipolytica DSM 11003 TaxID=1123382 RepID=A0A1M5NJ98_9FIRM|nr:uroporphyrinogen-III C-methyltransferase [Thermosyntropha lipolytica]SHG89620.1 uroporphyrinogen-III synthase /uroporphyrinogen-III C-methyltransferase [Thermosyntropha lipolytica DSM 11003]
MSKKGFVYLVGAGPGDPGLFTLKGAKVLQKAEVVVYDRLVSDKILALANPEAEFIYVGKESSHHALPQEKINELLVKKASEGKVVVRLKGGDPFLFGRGGEEALYVKRHGVPFEVVPGITSAIAVPAYAGIPVTHRDATSTLAIITGHEKPGKEESSIRWENIATGAGTLVFLMGVENLRFICQKLMDNGRSGETPVALVRWGTLPYQEVLTGTLADIAHKAEQSNFKPPAVIVVGEVVSLREELKWVEDKPLWGKRIVVTRARAQASLLSEKIYELGGEAIEFPTIAIKPLSDLHVLHNALYNLEHYNWIIFTSVNAVEIFFKEMKGLKLDIRELKGVNICAIGPATRDKLEEKGLIVDAVPDEYRAEGILSLLQPKIKPGDWVLLPRAKGARSVLPQTLHAWGAHVNEVYLYEAVPVSTVSAKTREEIIKGRVDYITFTSSSTVSNFVKIIGRENIPSINNNTRIACIGPITAETAAKEGFKVQLVAGEYTIDGLVNVLVEDAKALS